MRDEGIIEFDGSLIKIKNILILEKSIQLGLILVKRIYKLCHKSTLTKNEVYKNVIL